MSAAVFYNVVQSAPSFVDGSSPRSLTVPATGIALAFASAGAGGLGPNPGSSAQLPNGTSNQTSGAGGGITLQTYFGYSNIYPDGEAVTITISGSTGSNVFIALQPQNSPVTGYAFLTSTNFDVSSYKKFLGFATTGGTAGQSITVQASGLVTGLTGLTPDTIYYLNDTAGTIGTSAGTNTKFVGIALSSTTLLLKDALS